MHNINKRIYLETFTSSDEAIEREKQLKGGSRKRKDELIKKVNPNWNDVIKKFYHGMVNCQIASALLYPT